ncbi:MULTISPECIES: hypothetical protein [unclassified Mammaliicoccus]|uniref:hypothetical protein n=1 Tax=unclassified Mammaliicoccus TaxID=2803851 RepID=UPI001EFAA27C|nr:MULTISPECIES: hypothetical protein [unclassified Mammaliicoccus]
MYIDGNMIVEYMQESASGFKWSSLFAPILTFLIGVATVWVTYANTKRSNDTVKQIEKENRTNNNEILEKQNKFIEEMKNKELNANIIAQARIDWLQQARDINVQFIKACYDLIEDKMKNGTVGKSDSITKFDNEFWRLYYTLVLLYPVKGEGDDPEKDNVQNKDVIEHVNAVRTTIFCGTGNANDSKKNYYDTVEETIKQYAYKVSKYSKLEWQKIKKL